METRAGKDSKYKNLLTLTEKGKHVGQLISDEVLLILADLAKVTTHEERVVFFDCLSKIANGLDEIIDRRIQELETTGNIIIDDE